MPSKSALGTYGTIRANNEKPLISVIITNYNYGKYIGQAIESVLRQTYKNTELIIIDDGSTDNSDEIIKKYLNKYPEIIYVNQKNHGVVYSRNKGMEMAKGQYLCCLDADDFFNPDYIEKNYKCITQHKADVVYPNWQFVGDYSHKVDFPEFDFIEYQKQHFHIKPESLIRSSAIKLSSGKLKHAYIPETKARANDWAYFISLAANGLKFKLAKNNYINYRIKPDSMGNRLTRYEDIRIFYQYLTMLKQQYGEKIIEPVDLPIQIIKDQDARNNDLQQENNALLQQNNDLQQENNALLQQNNDLQQENNAIKTSLSWRLTKPLRAINKLVK